MSAPATVEVDCFCGGHNAGCVKCDGTGKIVKRACPRCHGTGKDGGRCPDCRGAGWRELDNNFDALYGPGGFSEL